MDASEKTMAVLAFATVAALGGHGQTQAADMLTYPTVAPGAYRPPPPRKVYYQPAYRELECTQAVVTYRFPYEPHSEIITHCHPPIDWLK